MENKEILMSLSLVVSVLALIISALSFKNNKTGLNHTINSFNLEHSTTLLGFIKVINIDGHRMDTEFRLLNHGAKDITIEDIRLTGKARSSVGSEYGLLNSTFSTNGAKPLKANGELKFDAGFIVGYGTLKTVEMMAFIEGIDSKHEKFEVALPVKFSHA